MVISMLASEMTVLVCFLLWSLWNGRDGTSRCPYDSSIPSPAFSIPINPYGSNGASLIADNGRVPDVLRRRAVSLLRSSLKILQDISY